MTRSGGRAAAMQSDENSNMRAGQARCTFLPTVCVTISVTREAECTTRLCTLQLLSVDLEAKQSHWIPQV